MPNHVMNYVEIDADTDSAANDIALIESVAVFLGLLNEQPIFDINKILPYPSLWAEMDAASKLVYQGELDQDEYIQRYGTASDGFDSGGYEWCRQNWGTEWGAYNVEYNAADRIAVYQTAWSPINQSIFAEIGKMFPQAVLTIEYYERGCTFCGGYTVNQGAIEQEWHCDNYRGFRGG